MSLPSSGLKRIFFLLNRLEEAVLGLLMASMVLLGTLQILFRNVFSISLFWIDPLLDQSVLWIALLGASVATRKDRHISIDFLSGRLGPRSRSWVRSGLFIFSSAVCLLLVRPALQFVQEEREVGKILAFGIPVWASQTIMPVMLTVLGLRFLGRAWNTLKNKVKT
jgi:TRAP-type C4-dicarboxylate transport system permease small subunit